MYPIHKERKVDNNILLEDILKQNFELNGSIYLKSPKIEIKNGVKITRKMKQSAINAYERMISILFDVADFVNDEEIAKSIQNAVEILDNEESKFECLK